LRDCDARHIKSTPSRRKITPRVPPKPHESQPVDHFGQAAVTAEHPLSERWDNIDERLMQIFPLPDVDGW
jgi:hypothetical protein